MASRSSFAAGAVALAIFAGGYWLMRRDEVADAAPEPKREAPLPAPTVPVPSPPVAAPLPTPESAGIAQEDCILYPDGTRLPPLNGVTKAPAVSFHRWAPFTKVLRKERDPRSGLEWYVHENGARSTTRWMLRNGVQEAVGEVELPAAPRPLVDDR